MLGFFESFGKAALYPSERKSHFKNNEKQTAIQASSVFSALFKVLVIHDIYKNVTLSSQDSHVKNFLGIKYKRIGTELDYLAKQQNISK